jgi:hypothetical protein
VSLDAPRDEALSLVFASMRPTASRLGVENGSAVLTLARSAVRATFPWLVSHGPEARRRTEDSIRRKAVSQSDGGVLTGSTPRSACLP